MWPRKTWRTFARTLMVFVGVAEGVAVAGVTRKRTRTTDEKCLFCAQGKIDFISEFLVGSGSQRQTHSQTRTSQGRGGRGELKKKEVLIMIYSVAIRLRLNEPSELNMFLPSIIILRLSIGELNWTPPCPRVLEDFGNGN